MAESRIAVYGAIAANVAIAVTKFIVAGISGSAAMMSEGIHSAVDTFNGILLLIGLRLSQRPATEEHPFGHGKELYFWSLIVAVLIFGIGGGVSFYEGILHVREPVPLSDPTWNYVVLGFAALFEGSSFLLALRQFKSESGKTPFWRALDRSKDPTTYTVLAEDSAALVGLAVAGAGIYFSHALNRPELDGVASILIGILLAGVAVLLIRQSRGLLIGEGVRLETAQAIRAIATSQSQVCNAGRALTMYIGPDEVLLALDLQFVEDTSAVGVARAVERIEKEIRERFPKITRIYLEARVATPEAAGLNRQQAASEMESESESG